MLTRIFPAQKTTLKLKTRINQQATDGRIDMEKKNARRSVDEGIRIDRHTLARDLDPVADANGLAEPEFLAQGFAAAGGCGVGQVGHFGGEEGFVSMRWKGFWSAFAVGIETLAWISGVKRKQKNGTEG